MPVDVESTNRFRKHQTQEQNISLTTPHVENPTKNRLLCNLQAVIQNVVFKKHDPLTHNKPVLDQKTQFK